MVIDVEREAEFVAALEVRLPERTLAFRDETPDLQAASRAFVSIIAVDESRAELEVIVVSAEPDDQALLELPEGLRPGWDPAGALAAKLSVATFPTMIVVDRDGVVSTVLNGWSDDVRTAISTAVADASL